MITRFSVKNFRSFEDWIEFDLETEKKYEFNNQALEDDRITNAMIYGENAEGKSNLGLAMVELTSHLCADSSRIMQYQDGCFLNANSNNKLAEFKFIFHLSGKTVEYSYGKDSDFRVLYEDFKIEGKTILSMDRREDFLRPTYVEINLFGAESLNRAVSENVVSIITYVQNNSSLCDDINNSIFFEFIKFVEGMVCIQQTPNTAVNYVGVKPTHKGVFEQIIDGNGIEEFQDFLNDFGIKCKLDIQEDLNRKRVVFVYDHGKIDFISSCSSGTRAITLLYCWLERIRDGRVTFAFLDEFDAFYHHKLSKKIADYIFKTPAQIILSTHNTSIMSNDLLRPDCYFEIKGGKIRPLHELSDRELRKAHNLEKMYRSGAFNESE